MRSRSMQSLTDAIKRRFPGVVVYGVGDAAHMLRTSDHNEDDTPGSRAAQSDADSTPEHRAIDVMLGAAFSKAQAYELIADLLADPAALRRLKYIIFDGWIWSRSNGWEREEFDGDDKHRDHPHISGLAADDENAAGWPAVEGDDMDAYEKAALRFIDNRLAAIVQGKDDVEGTRDATQARGEDVWLVRTLKALAADMAVLKSAPPQQPIVTDEQLERVLRKVLGGLDGASPASPA